MSLIFQLVSVMLIDIVRDVCIQKTLTKVTWAIDGKNGDDWFFVRFFGGNYNMNMIPASCSVFALSIPLGYFSKYFDIIRVSFTFKT